MVGYAVGELAKPLELSEDEVEDSLTRWHPQHGQDDCYEVVTAWVHPRYNMHIYNMYTTCIHNVMKIHTCIAHHRVHYEELRIN